MRFDGIGEVLAVGCLILFVLLVAGAAIGAAVDGTMYAYWGCGIGFAAGIALGTVQRSGGSCRFSKGRVCIGDPAKSMPKSSAERAVVDGAADLEQQISATS